jgi:hypothetical protein
MKRGLFVVAGLILLLSACQRPDREQETAMNACTNEAVQQMETADVAADQRATWQENYVRECMAKKGFKS